MPRPAEAAAGRFLLRGRQDSTAAGIPGTVGDVTVTIRP